MLPLLSEDGWILDAAVEGDIDRLMRWFPDQFSTGIWGGPGFRSPYTRHSFAEDMHWGRMASFSLRNPDDEFAAFGQIYERVGCINLARLVANPDMRGHGVGKRLVGMLMIVGRGLFSCPKFSLFVYRDNTPAYQCYTSMGFVRSDYPDKMPLGEDCDYLTRPVTVMENSHAS